MEVKVSDLLASISRMTGELSAKDAEIERLKTKNVELLDHANAVNSDCEQLEVEVERLKAENQRYERLFTSREQDHKELCERYDQLEAQLTASDGRVMVAETMLADFYHRAKDCDKDSRSPVDSVPPIVVVRHIVWQYETAFRKATDAANAMEAP